MNYQGNPCPVCLKDFSPEDDIVVCPECGTPHHRECYASRGECAHAEEHGDFVWHGTSEPESSEHLNEETTLCPECGAQCPPDVLACPECGAPVGGEKPQPMQSGEVVSPFALNEETLLQGIPLSPDTDIDGVSVRNAAMFTQVGAAKYVPKFYRMSCDESKGKITWNWAAFFFSPYWFFYRKLFKVGLLFLGLSLTLTLIFAPFISEKYEPLYGAMQELTALGADEEIPAELAERYSEAYSAMLKPFGIYMCVYSAVNAVAALTADRFYKKKMLTDIKTAERESEGDERIFASLLLRRGGVSFLAVVTVVLVSRLIISFVSMLAET